MGMISMIWKLNNYQVIALAINKNNMKETILFILFGFIIGVIATKLYSYGNVRKKKLIWIVWMPVIPGIVSLYLSVDTFLNSYIEHESQAAWMGLGMFTTIGVFLLVIGYQLLKKLSSESL